MSNITPIGNAASVLELLEKLESPLITLGTTTDALEAIEDEFADLNKDRDRGTYAQIWLVREKLREVHKEMESLCEQARIQRRES